MPGGLIACHECDALQRDPALAPGGVARCHRCNATLYRRARHGVDHTLALVCAAAALFVIANAFPIVSLDVQGQEASTTLLGAVRALSAQDMQAVAALVLLTTFVAPGLALAAMLYLLVPLTLDRLAPGFVYLLRLIQATSPWGMLEVFVLGIVVSLVKLAHVAAVVPGVGMWAFGALMLVVVAAAASYDVHAIWERVEALEARRAGAARSMAA